MKIKLQTLLKHKLQWLVLLAALLGVSQEVLAYTMEKGKAITVEGGWGSSISTTTSDNNHYTATFYVQKKSSDNDKYWMKLKQDGKWYSYGGYWFTSSVTGGAEVWKDAQGGNDYLVTTNVTDATSGYVKCQASIYVEYSNKSQYWITQTGVGSISASVSVGGSNPRYVGTAYTLTASASGGTGSYRYQFYDGNTALGSSQTSNTYSWTPSTTGTHSIKVTITDGNISAYSVTSSTVDVTISASCTTPTPTTANTPSAYSYTTATLTGTYPTTSGYCAVTAKGICYGTSSNPTTKYPDTTSGSGSISYVSIR